MVWYKGSTKFNTKQQLGKIVVNCLIHIIMSLCLSIKNHDAAVVSILNLIHFLIGIAFEKKTLNN